MRRVQLRALLSACPPSIVFDARARELPLEGDDAANGRRVLAPFFEHSLLKNTMLLKTVVRSAGEETGIASRTRIYFPFDPRQPGNGGMSLQCDAEFDLKALEKFSGIKLDRARIDNDLRKIPILVKLPSFAPFLLRDAFERSGLCVDLRHFRVSDAEAFAMRDALKAKLKPLAAMALSLPATSVGDSRLDLLARKLWDLDDPDFLATFGHALKIAEGETTDVLYAWIGVSYFQREFAKRQSKLRELGEWLGKAAPRDGMLDEQRRQLETDRAQVRDGLRRAWAQAGAIFARYNSSYDALIGSSDARPFVEYLTTVRADFIALGAQLALIEQCVCVYDAVAAQERGSQLSSDLLQDLAAGMRGGVDARELDAA
jgi:hypothetical protein